MASDEPSRVETVILLELERNGLSHMNAFHC